MSDKNIKIKKKFKLPFRNLKLEVDGAAFGMGDGSPDFILVVGHKNITAEKVKELKQERIEFRYLANEHFILPLLRIGDNYFELEFNPYTHEADRIKQMKMTQMITMMIYDRNDRYVRGIRTFRINDIVYQKWLEKVEAMADLNQRDIRFDNFIRSTKSQGSSIELWNRASSLNDNLKPADKSRLFAIKKKR